MLGIDSQGISQITLMVIVFAGLSVIGGISLLTFSKTYGTIFLGSPRKEFHHDVSEVSFLMLFPQYLIIAVMLSVSIFPGFYLSVISRITPAFLLSGNGLANIEMTGYLSLMKNLTLGSLLFVLIISFLFVVRYIFTRGSESGIEETWGCGYQAPNPRMQYTGKSFSKSFGKLLNFMIIEKKRLQGDIE